MNIQASLINDKDRWSELLNRSKYSSYRQDYSFVLGNLSEKQECFTFVFSENDIDIAGVQYIVTSSKFNLLKVGDIRSGIVFSEDLTKEKLFFIVKHFLNWAEEHKIAYVRIQPWLPKSVAGLETCFIDLFNRVLQGFSFEILNDGPHTYWIDLSIDKEEQLMKMNRKTRYEVRQGLKSNINIEITGAANPELINKFWLLYKTLGEKKGFKMYTREKFIRELRILLESGVADLYVSRYHNIIVNMSIASNSGIASYLHGAINPEFKKLIGCPSPGQYAQWAMINEVGNRNAQFYDMGFCPGPTPDTSHPAYHIWRFKYGFGGDHVQFLPTYGKKISTLKGSIFNFLINKRS